MPSSREKMHEILIDPEIGSVKIVMRPHLPFLPEGFRLKNKKISLFGEGKKVDIGLEDGQAEAITDQGEITLFEFSLSSGLADRETILSEF